MNKLKFAAILAAGAALALSPLMSPLRRGRPFN
jgi:hypothetical protein